MIPTMWAGHSGCWRSSTPGRAPLSIIPMCIALSLAAPSRPTVIRGGFPPRPASAGSGTSDHAVHQCRVRSPDHNTRERAALHLSALRTRHAQAAPGTPGPTQTSYHMPHDHPPMIPHCGCLLPAPRTPSDRSRTTRPMPPSVVRRPPHRPGYQKQACLQRYALTTAIDAWQQHGDTHPSAATTITKTP